MRGFRRFAWPLVAAAVLLPFGPLVLWAFSHRWYFPQVVPEQWGLRAWTGARRSSPPAAPG